MIPGLNHNVRYKERLFHVQTEDSGLERPVLMTHVFIGGTIVATERSDYGALIERIGDIGELRKVVTKEMQEQHKLCIKNLLRGQYDPIILGLPPDDEHPAAPTAVAAPAADSPPIPTARRSAPPIPEIRKSAPPIPAVRRSAPPIPEPTGGAHLTSPGRGQPNLSALEAAAPTERPRPSQPIPHFDELEVQLIDPAAFASEDEILSSLDMLPPLPATFRNQAAPSDTLLDLPAFDFAEDDPVGTLPPLPTPELVHDTERPSLRPSFPTIPPEPGAPGLKTTPAPASNRPRFQRPQTRPPAPRVEPSRRPGTRPPEPARPTPVVWTQQAPPSFWPESPEPRATQEVSVAFPKDDGATRRDPPAAGPDVRRTSPELRAVKKGDDAKTLPPGFKAPSAPASWPPPAEPDADQRKTVPPDAEVPDFLLQRGRGSDRPEAKRSARPIRVEETSLDEIITGYLDKSEE